MSDTIEPHEHASIMRDTLQAHVTVLRDLDYQLLQALELLRSPHDLASVNSTLRQARRRLAAHLEATDAAAWEHGVRAALDPDAQALFPQNAHSHENARIGGPPPEGATRDA